MHSKQLKNKQNFSQVSIVSSVLEKNTNFEGNFGPKKKEILKISKFHNLNILWTLDYMVALIEM